MHDADNRIAFRVFLADDAERKQIVELVGRHVALSHFLINRIKMFRAARYRNSDTRLLGCRTDLLYGFFEVSIPLIFFLRDDGFDLQKHVGIRVL